MTPYVDGFLLVVPASRQEAYLTMAQQAGAIWREHGALEYRECLGDDLEPCGPDGERPTMGSFRTLLRLTADERAILAWITYPDRAARDRINASVMADPRLQEACPGSWLDMTRLHWGGFRTVVQVPGSAEMPTVMPHLTCTPANAAIGFYQQVFGATELARLTSPDGRILHAALQIGGAQILLNDRFETCLTPEPGPQPGVQPGLHVHVRVDNVDAVFERALAGGAAAVMPVDDMFWGDRYGVFEDPFGHRWAVATPIRTVSADEIQQAWANMTAAQPTSGGPDEERP